MRELQKKHLQAVEKRQHPNAGLTAMPDDSMRLHDPDTQQQMHTTSSPCKLAGYAVVFNSPAMHLGGFMLLVAPHAFEAVDLSDVYMVSNQAFSLLLASTCAGT